MRAVSTMCVIVLMGCANTLPPPVSMPEPPRELWPQVQVEAQVMVKSTAPSLLLTNSSVSAADSYAGIVSANGRALVRPRREWFRGSTQVYPREDDLTYLIPTKDQVPTRLTFDPPERVIKIHPDYGDDDWFDISLMERESERSPDYVIIIPKAPKQKKDVLIVTTEHAYSLRLESSATYGLVSVRWKHEEPPVVVPKPLLPSGLYYADLEIQPVHGSPPWTPLAAWAIPSVGKTLVQYPPAVKRFGLPVIKAIGADGESTETMNWIPKGDFIEIHRFFQVAEVRFGHEDLAVVRIAQTAKMRSIWCPGSEGCPNPELAQ